MINYMLLNKTSNEDTVNSKLTVKAGHRLFSLLASNVDGSAIFVTDPDGNVLTWNSGATQITGYTEKDITGQPASVFYTPEDIRKHKPQNDLKAALKKGTHQSRDWLVKKGGAFFLADVTLAPLYEDDGEFTGFAVFIRDITQQEELKHISRESHAMPTQDAAEVKEMPTPKPCFQKLIDNSYDGIALIDSNFKVYYRSRSAGRISGWSDTDRAGSDFITLVHPDDRAPLENAIRVISAKPGSSTFVNFRARHKLGHYIWVENLYTNMLDDPDVRAIVCNFRDVTERIQAENLAKERSGQIDLFLNRVTDGFISLDSNFCYTYVNKKFCDSVGLTPDQLLGKNVWDMFPQAVGSETYNAFYKAFNEQRFVQSEDYFEPLGIWYEDNIYPSEAGLSVFIKDITERRKAEQQVLEHQEELRKALEMQTGILNALPPLIALLNKDGKIIAVNDSWKKFTFENNLGIPHYGVGYNYLAICEKAVGIEKVYIDKVARGIKSVISGEVAGFELEHPEDLTDKKHWFQLLVAPLQDKSQKNVIVMHIDITDRKIAEESLIKSEANLRSIYENTDLSIVLLGTDLKIVSFNTNAQKLAIKHFGKKLKIGSFGPDFLPKERRGIIQDSVKRARNNEIVSYEAMYNMPDGSTEWFDVKWIGVRGEKGENVGLILTFKNITNKKRYEKERSKLTADLVQRNNDLEEYAYIVSHNLRAPVANILGLLNILTLSEPISEDISETINALSVSTGNLDNVVIGMNQILQGGRNADDHYEWVSFSAIVDEIKQDIWEVIVRNNATIQTCFNSIDKLWTRKSFLYNIFLNLITNGIKYKKNGHDPLIAISSGLEKNTVTLIFEDNGIGIDLEKHGQQLFGLYKRFDRHTQGKGMGLFMVKTQVESLDGTVSVQSAPFQGTRFIIGLPLANDDETA